MSDNAKDVASKSIFVPLRPRRNFEEVAQQIKTHILSGQLKPLERLPSEREMAEQFNAGRNTVREAYRILEETGFIRMKTGNTGGAMVCAPDGSRITQSLSDLAQMGCISLREITQSRLTLELAALEESFAYIDNDHVAALENCLAEAAHTVHADNDSPSGGPMSNLYNFHVILAQVSNNRVYSYLVASLVNISVTFLRQYVSQNTSRQAHFRDHRNILNALIKKDKQASKALLKKHILRMDREISRLMISDLK